MTEAELALLLATRATLWPAAVDPEAGLQQAAWLRVLSGVTFEECLTALEVLSRDGLRFPPLAGEIAKRAIENRQDEVLIADVWPDVLAQHGRGRRSENAAVRALAERIVAEDTANTIGQSYEADWPTLAAQTRERAKAMLARDLRDQLYAPVGGSAPRIEAARERMEIPVGRLLEMPT